MLEEKLRGCGRPSRAFREKTGKGTSYQADAKAEPFLEGNGACDLTMDSCLVWQGQGRGGGNANHGCFSTLSAHIAARLHLNAAPLLLKPLKI